MGIPPAPHALPWLEGLVTNHESRITPGFGVALGGFTRSFCLLPPAFSRVRSCNHEMREKHTMAGMRQNWGARRMGEQCSFCKPFIFGVFGVFRGLTCRSRVQWTHPAPTKLSCIPPGSVASSSDFSLWAAQVHIYRSVNRCPGRDTSILPLRSLPPTSSATTLAASPSTFN
jgi:hypothetical protein